MVRELIGHNAKVDAALNPKHAVGSAKPSTHHIPPAALFQLGAAMRLGAEKYGAYNWGDAGVVASIYYDAIQRHLSAWWTGEDSDTESEQSHLAHIMACCAILIDCQLQAKLHDDRPKGKTFPAADMLRVLSNNTRTK